jgi:hypothetical protein
VPKSCKWLIVRVGTRELVSDKDWQPSCSMEASSRILVTVENYAFSMARKIIQKILEGVAVIAGGVWLLAPVTRYLALVAFVATSVVLLICFFGLRLLNDADSGWWPPRRGPSS